MPIRVVRIIHRINALRICRIFYVEEDPVAGACTGRESDLGIDGDVVALVCFGRAALTMDRRAGDTVICTRRRIHEQPGRRYDLGVLR